MAVRTDPLVIPLAVRDTINQNAIKGANGHKVGKLVSPLRDMGRQFFRAHFGPGFSKQNPAFQHVHVRAMVQWPDNILRDTMNWYPTGKALVDGFTDGGLVTDDNYRHLVGPHLFTDDVLSGKRGLCLFRFYFTEWTPEHERRSRPDTA